MTEIELSDTVTYKSMAALVSNLSSRAVVTAPVAVRKDSKVDKNHGNIRLTPPPPILSSEKKKSGGKGID